MPELVESLASVQRPLATAHKPAPIRGAFKLEEARQYLGGVSVPTMHRLCKRGLLKPCRSLRHLLFTKAELDRFLSSGQWSKLWSGRLHTSSVATSKWC